MDIKEALGQLDTLEDKDWTGDGMPMVDRVSEIMGETVTRQQITDAAPKFSRKNTELEDETSTEDGDGDAEEQDGEADLSIVEAYLEDEPMTERDFVDYLGQVPKESLDALQGVLVEQMAIIGEKMSQAEELHRRVKISLAYTRNRIKMEVPDVSNQQAIQEFIKSQSEQRGAQVKRTREILDGVDLSSLDPRSPIDRAMARKTGRGASRPVR